MAIRFVGMRRLVLGLACLEDGIAFAAVQVVLRIALGGAEMKEAGLSALAPAARDQPVFANAAFVVALNDVRSEAI